MSKIYMFARATKESIKTASPLNKNTNVIFDLLTNEDYKNLFNYKCPNNISNKNWIKDSNGNNLEYIIFVDSENRKNKFYEHLCNLNKYNI